MMWMWRDALERVTAPSLLRYSLQSQSIGCRYQAAERETPFLLHHIIHISWGNGWRFREEVCCNPISLSSFTKHAAFHVSYQTLINLPVHILPVSGKTNWHTTTVKNWNLSASRMVDAPSHERSTKALARKAPNELVVSDYLVLLPLPLIVGSLSRSSLTC